jgi:hypothetical protein
MCLNCRIVGPFTSQALIGLLLFVGGVGSARASDWKSVDVGNVGVAGSASENQSVWNIQGAGGDIWGSADAFHFVYRQQTWDGLRMSVRIDDLQDTNAFAKAGLMWRTSTDPAAAGLILDAKPSGEIEFMYRPSDGADMQYLGGTTAHFPMWLRLDWLGDCGSTCSTHTNIVASVSQDGVNWSEVARSVSFPLTSSGYVAGAAVTSHNASELATAHLDRLTILPSGDTDYDIGSVGIPSNAAFDSGSGTYTIQAAGADVWGTADSVGFVSLGQAPGNPPSLATSARVVSLGDTNPFAKAGLMARDTPAAGAMQVIVDAKPSGEIEFMARLCTGCNVTYLGGATLAFPGYVGLTQNGTTFTAYSGPSPTSMTAIGSITVPMSSATFGFAVTSHDTSVLTTAVFDSLR